MEISEKKRYQESVEASILTAYRQMALKDGWQNFSMRKLAEAIEYSPTVIYQHFENKDTLLYELHLEGNMIVFGAASGEPTQIFAHQLMQKGSSVTGYSLFNENPVDMIEFTKKLFEYVGSGKLEIILDAYPFADVKKAQHDMQSRLTKGKVVLSQE